MKKLLSIAAGIGLVFLGLWYWHHSKVVAPVNSTPAPEIVPEKTTAKEEVYTNNKYGYQITYPNGGKLINDGDDNIDVSLWDAIEIPNNSNAEQAVQGVLDIGIKVEKAYMSQNYNDISKSIENSLHQERIYNKPTKSEHIIIGGQDAYYRQYEYEGYDHFSFAEYVIYFVKSGYLYSILGTKPANFEDSKLQTSPYFTQLKQAVALQQQIIDSFKFTD